MWGNSLKTAVYEPGSFLLPSTTWGHCKNCCLWTRKLFPSPSPCEDTVKALSVKQEVGLTWHRIWQHFDFGLSSLQNVEDKCLLFLSYQLYGIFLIAARVNILCVHFLEKRGCAERAWYYCHQWTRSEGTKTSIFFLFYFCFVKFT